MTTAHLNRALALILLVVVALASSFSVRAQPVPGGAPAPAQQQELQPLTPEQMEAITAGTASSLEIVRALFRVVDTAIGNFVRGNPALVVLGRRIALALYLVILSWGIMKSWILDQGMGQVLPDFIQPTIILALTYWAITNLAPAVSSSITGLSGVFTSTMGPGARVPTEVDIVSGMVGASFDLIAAGPQGQGWGAVLDKMVSFVGRCFAALALIVGAVLGAGVMMVGKIQVAIAILFAPVLIPWAMWKPTNFLFNAWLSFLIGGAMQTVMAAGLAAMALPIISQLAALSAASRAGTAASYTMLACIIVIALLIAYIFLRATSLANSLVGSAAIGIEGWASQAMSIASGGIGLAKLGAKAATGAASGGLEFGKGLKSGIESSRGGAPGGDPNGRSGLVRSAGQFTGKAAHSSASKLRSEFPKAPPRSEPSMGGGNGGSTSSAPEKVDSP